MQEILFIELIVLLFFGGKKIPELMKGLDKGVKSFKEGMNGVEDDIDGKDKKGETKEWQMMEQQQKLSLIHIFTLLVFQVFLNIFDLVL